MNKVILMGRLTKDPEIRYTGTGEPIAIARYTIAVNRPYKKDGQTQADFINVVSYRKAAEFIEKYFRKGMKANICGRIQTGSYTNKDGNKVYTTDVLVEEIEFGESKNSNQQSAAPANPSNAVNPMTDENGFMNIPDGIDEELPFA